MSPTIRTNLAHVSKERVGFALFALIAGIWVGRVAILAVQTTHSIPDYGDLTRWIVQLIIPLSSSDDPDVLAGIFSEYAFPGHGHVLTKSLIYFISQYFSFDFALLRNVGYFSYFSLLAVLMANVGYDMGRFRRRQSGFVLILMFVILVHPEELNSLTNNLLAFEYTFLLLSWLLVISAYRVIVGAGNLFLVAVILALAAVFADIPFTLALLAVYVLIFCAVYSGERTLRQLLPIIVVSTAIPVLIILAGADGNQSAARQSFDLIRFLKWTCGGIGSGFLSVQSLISLGFSREEGYSILVGLGALIFAGILATTVDVLLNRTRANLGTAMIVFGVMAVVGTYATRNNLGDHYVLSDRYVRYYTFAPLGLAWYWLIARRPVSLMEAKPISTLRFASVSICGLLLIVFLQQVIISISIGELKAKAFARMSAEMQAFADGDFSKFDNIKNLMPYLLKDSPENAQETLRFFYDCSRKPEVCKIGR